VGWAIWRYYEFECIVAYVDTRQQPLTTAVYYTLEEPFETARQYPEYDHDGILGYVFPRPGVAETQPLHQWRVEQEEQGGAERGSRGGTDREAREVADREAREVADGGSRGVADRGVFDVLFELEARSLASLYVIA
jgi:hypothetical protein